MYLDAPDAQIPTENQDEDHLTLMSYKQVLGRWKLECLDMEEVRNRNIQDECARIDRNL